MTKLDDETPYDSGAGPVRPSSRLHTYHTYHRIVRAQVRACAWNMCGRYAVHVIAARAGALLIVDRPHIGAAKGEGAEKEEEAAMLERQRWR